MPCGDKARRRFSSWSAQFAASAHSKAFRGCPIRTATEVTGTIRKDPLRFRMPSLGILITESQRRNIFFQLFFQLTRFKFVFRHIRTGMQGILWLE